jgi:[acyl-carrier-protein] S-malonyltransferase
MGKDVHDAFESARNVFEEAEECLGVSLRRICFDLSSDELRETRNAQLALLVNGAAVWAVLQEMDASPAVAAAGHSVGEYAAFHASGALSLAAVTRLVSVRGNAMAASGRSQPGAMAALLGTLNTHIDEICRQASSAGGVVVPANFNAPEQVVVSGTEDAVARAMELGSSAGARKVVRLNVSGAFHSPLMLSALGGLTDALRDAEFADPVIPVYCNVTSQPCTSAQDARELLETQLASPVRWVELMQNIERDFPESICLELGPGNVLAGLGKRCAPSLRTMPCGTARDLDAITKVLA